PTAAARFISYLSFAACPQSLSVGLYRCRLVPIAPSRIRTRSRAITRNGDSVLGMSGAAPVGRVGRYEKFIGNRRAAVRIRLANGRFTDLASRGFGEPGFRRAGVGQPGNETGRPAPSWSGRPRPLRAVPAPG